MARYLDLQESTCFSCLTRFLHGLVSANLDLTKEPVSWCQICRSQVQKCPKHSCRTPKRFIYHSSRGTAPMMVTFAMLPTKIQQLIRKGFDSSGAVTVIRYLDLGRVSPGSFGPYFSRCFGWQWHCHIDFCFPLGSSHRFLLGGDDI